MKKLLKILFVLICLPLVVFASAICFLKFADLNKYKPQIQELVQKYANTKIVINGDLDVGVSLKPSLELSDVEIYMPQQPDVKLAHIGTALVQISIVPLLHKEIMVDTIQTQDTKIFVDGNEQVNIKELFASMDSYDEPINIAYNTDITGMNINGDLVLSSLKDLKKTNFAETQVALTANAMGYKIEYNGWVHGLYDKITADGDYNIYYKSNQIRGKVTADLTQELPLITLQAASEKINVQDWLVSKKADAGWLISSARATEYITGTSIPYEYLQTVNADVILDIKKILVDSKISVNNLQADAHLKNGVFKANIKNVESLNAKLNGTISLDSPKKLPYAKLNISSSALDLSKLLAANQNPINMFDVLIGSAQASQLITNTPIPYQYLKMFNTDAGLNIKKLQLNNDISLSDIVAVLTLQNGVFKADIKNITAGTGTITGAVSVNASNQTAAADIKAANIILQKLYTPYANANNPQLFIQSGGVLNGLINVTTSGKNTDAYLANLSGKIIALADKSVVKIKSLERLQGNIIVQILDNLKINIINKDMTMKCAVVRSDIKSGRMSFPKGIAFDASEFYIVADGHINLPDDSLNLSLQPFSGKITDVNISSLLGSLLKIKGTIMQPKLSINQTQTAKSVIGAIASAGAYNVGDLMLSADSAPCYTALKGTQYESHFPQPKASVKNTVSQGYTNTKEAVKNLGDGLKNQAKNIKNQAKEIGNQLKGLFK